MPHVLPWSIDINLPTSVDTNVGADAAIVIVPVTVEDWIVAASKPSSIKVFVCEPVQLNVPPLTRKIG